MTMVITKINDNVRVVYTGLNPKDGDDIEVEVLQSDSKWAIVRTYNSMSDDYAWTNAKEYAKGLT